MQKPKENSTFSNIPVPEKLEDEIISRIDNIAALCAFQSMIIAEGLQLPKNHSGNYCLIIEDEVIALRKALSTLFDR